LNDYSLADLQGAESPTEEMAFKPHTLDGEEIYRHAINGTAIIDCPDCCGSGFLIDKKKGYVMTNSHVILDEKTQKPFEEISVTIAGMKSPAHVLVSGTPDTMDIALLLVEGLDPKATELALGDSSSVRNGERVYHLGNSLGQGLCITGGIVSDADRKIGERHYFMTDAAINPGNSGGPLVDDKGKVVGVAVMSTRGADGMKYSIPLNDALAFLREQGVEL